MRWREKIFIFFVIVALFDGVVIIYNSFKDPSIMYPESSRFESRTGYFPKQLNQVYYYDSIGEYRYYNELLVYKMSDPLFDEHVKSEWHPLGLPEDILELHEMRIDFDPMIEKMLADHEGYWTANLNESGKYWVCVYHTDDQMLYIRTWN
mgnify:FL=1